MNHFIHLCPIRAYVWTVKYLIIGQCSEALINCSLTMGSTVTFCKELTWFDCISATFWLVCIGIVGLTSPSTHYRSFRRQFDWYDAIKSLSNHRCGHFKLCKVAVRCWMVTVLWSWLCRQEESESLCQRHEERCGSVDAACCYFSSGAEFPADDSQPFAEISTDDERETRVAAETWKEPVQRRF